MTPPTQRQIFTKAGFELVAILALGAACLVVHKQEPFQRGFFCDDETLLHPYVDSEQFPTTTTFVIWIIVFLLIVVPVELFRNSQIKIKSLIPMPWLVLDLYRVFGHFIQGGLATLLMSEVSKVSIGRLRPHFLHLCSPDPYKCSSSPDKFWGTTPEDLQDVCTNFGEMRFQIDSDGNGTALRSGPKFDKMIREGRLAFMSGHASTSFYFALFLVLYLQVSLYHLIIHLILYLLNFPVIRAA